MKIIKKEVLSFVTHFMILNLASLTMVLGLLMVDWNSEVLIIRYMVGIKITISIVKSEKELTKSVVIWSV